MTAPAFKLTVTQRDRLRDLKWEKSQAVIAGRVMLCRGRHIVGYCNVDELANTKTIAAKADTVALSAADYDDVQEWLR